MLAGCASQSVESDPSGGFTSLFTGFGANDLKAKRNGNTQGYGTVTNPTASPGTQLYPGKDAAGNATGGDPGETGTTPGIREDADGFQLNFENADAATVCKTVLGDILGLNYNFDSRVAGQISLSSARPVPKASLVKILETALKSINAAVVREGSLYRIVPSSEAPGSGQLEIGSASEGFGTTVIPIKFVSVQTVARILENFATRPGAIKVEPSANLIIVQGTAQERLSAIDAAGVVDTDLMKQQSVGIFPLTNSSPEALIAELNKILETGEGGFGQNQVQFQPMTRMNGILVVAHRKDVLTEVTRWIRRLDQADPSAVGVKVYRLKYAQAKNVSAMLNDILAGRSSSSTGNKDQDALQPSLSSTGSGSLVQSAASGNGGTTGGQPGQATQSGGLGSSGASGIGQSGSTTGQSAFGSGTNPSGGNGQSGSSSGSDTGGSTGGGAGGGAGGAGAALPKVRVTADIVNNSLLIIASAQEYRIVEAAIRELDRAPTQVAIEATIAEVTLTDQLQYGVQAYIHNKNVGAVGLTTSATSAAISATVPGANLILGATSSPTIILNALHAFTNVKVLSSPSLVVIDNQPAVLQVGDQVAIKTQSSQSVDTTLAPIIDSITYKDTGIILRVLPHVHANGIVNLEVEQEISNVVDNTGGADGLTPTISQRRVKSNIVVSSGQTVLLAGMISESQNRSKSGLPGVVQWKWLGDLLSNTNNTAKRTELIIFVKPKIMHDQTDAQAISEEFRARLTSMRPEPGPVRLAK